MITKRLLSSVMLISANRIKVLRLWLTCFEDGPIRILTFAWCMLKTKKTMVSWQAFSSLPPRAPLAFLSHLKLPFPSLSNACHAGYRDQCMRRLKPLLCQEWCQSLKTKQKMPVGKRDIITLCFFLKKTWIEENADWVWSAKTLLRVFVLDPVYMEWGTPV